MKYVLLPQSIDGYECAAASFFLRLPKGKRNLMGSLLNYFLDGADVLLIYIDVLLYLDGEISNSRSGHLQLQRLSPAEHETCEFRHSNLCTA